MDYRKKIENILSNKVEFSSDLQVVIDELKTWLSCEWLSSDLSMEDYNILNDMIPIMVHRYYKENCC